jgi:ubiquinone/menaquinone biosynthesis C-methylase UbiE
MDELHAYRRLAKYYDVIYSFKEYRKDSTQIMRLISKYGRNKGKTLLDVGCGTGQHIKYFKQKYSCVGTDLNKEMLDIARKNVKGVEFKQRDMRNLNLDKRYDAITCLFSAIGYIKTPAQLKKTLAGFYNHLNPGGVCIIDAWFDKSHWKVGSVHMRVYDYKDLKIARVGYSSKRGNMSVLDEHYIIAEKNKGVTYVADKSELRLTERKEFLQLLKAVGFKPILLKEAAIVAAERDRYVGMKGGKS